MAENGILIIKKVLSADYIQILSSFVPIELKKYIQLYDLQRYDNYDYILNSNAIVFIINKN